MGLNEYPISIFSEGSKCLLYIYHSTIISIIYVSSWTLQDTSKSPLTLSNVSGIFHILIGGLVLSMLVSLVEYTVHRLRKQHQLRFQKVKYQYIAHPVLNNKTSLVCYTCFRLTVVFFFYSFICIIQQLDAPRPAIKIEKKNPLEVLKAAGYTGICDEANAVSLH